MIIPIKVYPTDTCLFITIQKVASRLLSSLFDDSEKTGTGFDYSIDILNKKVIPCETNLGPIQQKVLKDFDDIFSNKSQKNVVILYRNPENRLKSGIVQDFNSVIMDSNTADFSLYLLFKILNATPQQIEYLQNHKSALHLAKITNIELFEFLKKSFTLYMNFLSESNFDNHHNMNYLENFHDMINQNIFDINKLILCDIDTNSLNTLLDSFSLNVDYQHTNSNNEFKPIIESILLDTNNMTIIEKYNQKIKSENDFYTLLKTHPNNFKIEI